MSLLIILHEGGHFAAARLFKVRVEKFYLFFDFLFPFSNLLNFSLFKFKWGDTEYGLGWFPMGGYVKIAGMMDESNDKEAMAQAPQPWEYRSQKAWKRLIIILGGIIVNLIVGIVVLWGVKFKWGDTYTVMKDVPVEVRDSSLYTAGMRNGDVILGFKSFEQLNKDIILNDVTSLKVQRGGETLDIQLPDDIIKRIIRKKVLLVFPRIPFIVGEIPDSSINKGSGLMEGDRVTKIDTVPVQYFDEFAPLLKAYGGKQIPVQVERAGKAETLNLKVSETGKFEVLATDPSALSKLGHLKTETTHYGFFESFGVGVKAAFTIIGDYARQFKLFVRPETGALNEVGGFASMAKLFPDEWDWEAFWRLTAFLSLVLAFMNFLPIPMLDGGYMVFIIYEMITGKEPSEKFMNVANTIGFVIVIGLLVFANGNDLYKFIMKFFS